jgi:hypothetical protein
LPVSTTERPDPLLVAFVDAAMANGDNLIEGFNAAAEYSRQAATAAKATVAERNRTGRSPPIKPSTRSSATVHSGVLSAGGYPARPHDTYHHRVGTRKRGARAADLITGRVA